MEIFTQEAQHSHRKMDYYIAGLLQTFAFLLYHSYFHKASHVPNMLLRLAYAGNCTLLFYCIKIKTKKPVDQSYAKKTQQYPPIANSTPALKKDFNALYQNGGKSRLFNEKSQNLAKSVMQNAQKEQFQTGYDLHRNSMANNSNIQNLSNYDMNARNSMVNNNSIIYNQKEQTHNSYIYTNPLQDENFYKGQHNFGTVYNTRNNETRFSNNPDQSMAKSSLAGRNNYHERDSRCSHGVNVSQNDNSRSYMNTNTNPYNRSRTPLSKPTPMASRDYLTKPTPGMHSVNKASIKSKIPIVSQNEDIFSRKMGFFVSNEKDYEQSIIDIGADPSEFKKWVTYHVKSFIASRLIPMILSENHKNINAINSLIMHFGKKLKESEIFEKDYNPDQRLGSFRNDGFSTVPNYMNQSSNQSRNEESITIDHLLDAKFKIDNLKSEWGSFWKIQTEMKSAADLNNLTKKLNDEILRRRYLDSLLNIIDFELKNTRSYIFSRQISLSENGFFSEEQRNYEAPRGKPADREIILFSFLFFVIEHNFYYRKGISIDNILLKQNFNWVKKEDNGFYIRQIPGNKYNYLCYSGSKELNCLYGDLNIYCLIVFFLFHMKTKQMKSISGSENSLLWILEKFNISKGDVMVG